MWQLALPIVVCACGDENSAVVAIVAIVVVVYVMRQQERSRSPPPVPFGPVPLPVSARLADTREGETPAEDATPATVPNPRKAQTDLVVEEEGGVRSVPQTHIVGFRPQPSSESRRRLLDRQYEELRRNRPHQY